MTAAVDLPIQAQCEPPDDDRWFQRLADSGVVSLGMHLEAVTDEVRQRIMPGKAEVPLSRYFEAFSAAVEVFGRGQVSTYILAGLGDSETAISEMSERLCAHGRVPLRGALRAHRRHAPGPSPKTRQRDDGHGSIRRSARACAVTVCTPIRSTPVAPNAVRARP